MRIWEENGSCRGVQCRKHIRYVNIKTVSKMKSVVNKTVYSDDL